MQAGQVARLVVSCRGLDASTSPALGLQVQATISAFGLLVLLCFVFKRRLKASCLYNKHFINREAISPDSSPSFPLKTVPLLKCQHSVCGVCLVGWRTILRTLAPIWLLSWALRRTAHP